MADEQLQGADSASGSWYDPKGQRRYNVYCRGRRMNGLAGWKVWYYIDCGFSVGGFPTDQAGLDEFLKDKVLYTGINQPDKLWESYTRYATAAAKVGVII